MRLTHPFVLLGALLAGGAGFVFWNENRRESDARQLAALPEQQRIEVKAERALPKKATPSELAALQSMRERWNRSVQLASSTSRMSLPPVIIRLQDLRTETASMQFGECLEPTRKPLLEIMDMEAQTHIEFLSSASSINAEIELRENMRERAASTEQLTNQIDMQTRICTA